MGSTLEIRCNLGVGLERKNRNKEHLWLPPKILSTQEAEILSQKKKKITKKGWWSGSRCRP
jgi:hypothetical protein